MGDRQRFVKHGGYLVGTRPGYLDPIEATDLPLLLAERHRSLPVGAVVSLADLMTGFTGSGERSEAPASAWESALTPEAVPFDDLVVGAGFRRCGPDRVERIESLADVVGPSMRLLVVGLNPSPAAADTGVAFARPGNRFWPAARAAGLVTVDRDPWHAIAHHGIGFTDLAKRTTRRAAELDDAELQAGQARVDRLCRWLRPEACVMVGLLGWRVAVDRSAVAGWQPTGFGGRPVYLMPSTSGLNAHASPADLTTHLAAAAAGPPTRSGLSCRQ